MADPLRPARAALLDALIQQESGGDPNAVSPKGARGRMQVLPSTARDPGFGIEPARNDSLAEFERVGRDFFTTMLARYNGDEELALIAYNAGPGNADKFQDAGRDYGVLPKREETEPYVRNILAAAGDVPKARVTERQFPDIQISQSDRLRFEETDQQIETSPLFNETNALDRASRNITFGVPTGFFENLQSSFHSLLLTETTIQADMAMIEAYDRYIDEIHRATGTKLDNPLFRSDLSGPSPFEPHTIESFEESIRQRELEFAKKVEELGLRPRSPDAIREEARAIQRQAEQSKVDVSSRATFLGQVGQFVGGTSALISDPPVALSMLFGAPAATGILRTMAIEAGIAGGVTAATQPFVQEFRAQAGLDAGLERALENIGLAAAGGGIFAGALRGGIQGTRALLDAVRGHPKTAAQRAAELYVNRLQDIQEGTPFHASRRADSEHIDRFSRAQSDLMEGSGFRLAEDPRSGVREGVRKTTIRSSDILPSDAPAPVKSAFEVGQAGRQAALKALRETEDVTRASETARSFLRQDVDSVADFIRKGPKAPRIKPLVDFLKDNGGLKSDPELTALGITSRTRPGLISKNGRTLDEAGEIAAEAGFFSERPTVSDLLEAMDEEFNRGRPRLLDEDAVAQAEFDELSRNVEQARQALEDLGLDPDELTNAELRQALETISEAKPANGTKVQMGEARIAASQIEALEKVQDEVDDILETEVRDLYGEDLEQTIMFGEGDEVTVTTARELFEDLEANEKLRKEYELCLEVPF